MGGTSDGGAADESAGGSGTSGASHGDPIVEEVDVGLVWSGHPVSFALRTKDNRQYIGYYDSDKYMTIAMRELGSPNWEKKLLPTQCGWDSHESIRLALDKENYIHIAGNMHDDPLTYFRTTRPLDITSFKQFTQMVGSNESSVTYPEFFHNAQGDLLFCYRSGNVGSGSTYVNKFDTKSQTWSRLFGTPLLSGVNGTKSTNPYPVGPIFGPDGYWHLVWVWRDTPDAETNHDLSYARTRDMLNWENAAGEPLTLPITINSPGIIVDPVPVNGGMINNNTKVGFDPDNRAVITYHKFDSPGGATQLYNARFENGAWVVHQTTHRWGYRWAFQGGGTLIFPIEFEGVRTLRDGTLVQRYFHAYELNVDRKVGWGTFLIDPETLEAVEVIEQPLPYPRELDPPESPFVGMASRWAADMGISPDPDIFYMARWETLDSNRDQPREIIPPPTMLRVYAFSYSAMSEGL